MTPTKWARLHVFSYNYNVQVSDAQAYKQFGNSFAILIIQITTEKAGNCIL